MPDRLLTNEEIGFLRDAANMQENKLLLGDTTILAERAIVKAQDAKTLKCLKEKGIPNYNGTGKWLVDLDILT